MPLDNSPFFQMIELGTTGSTNDFLRDYRPPRQPEMTLVSADYQTAGRGQTGNSWEAAPGQNLLFSILVHPTFLHADSVFAISEAMALAIREALEGQLTGAPPTAGTAAASPAVSVKWPNDIYVGGSKIAGILIENEFCGTHLARSIIGCGINVNQSAFAFPALPATPTPAPPTSLALLTGSTHERSLVLDAVVTAFRRRYALLQGGRKGELHAEYHRHLYRREGMHPFVDAQGPFRASISHVEPSGHIVLSDEDHRLRRYMFKQVAFA